MPATPTYGLRWPLSTATPDVPRDLQNLAEDTESALGTVVSRLGAYVNAQAVLSNQTGSVEVAPPMTILDQRGGYTVNAGAITAPFAGAYRMTIGCEVRGEQIQVWIGQDLAPKRNMVVQGGFQAAFEYTVVQRINTAGANLPRPSIFAGPNTYNATLFFTVHYLGQE